MLNGNERAELRDIVRRAQQLYHKQQLCEADFEALVTHVLALEMKLTLDEAYARISHDINDWLEGDGERVTDHRYVGASS